jgi:hypothetical protein
VKSSEKDRGYLYSTQRTLFMQLATLRRVVAESHPQYFETWAFNKK